MHLVVIGAGELGGRVAARWDGPVTAVTRTTARHDALRAAGAEPTLEVPDLDGTHVLVCADVALSGSPVRAVLCSSSRNHGREAVFRAWCPAGVILRFGGLYRPGRGPVPAFRRRGVPPEGDLDHQVALVHYDDAATACLAALTLAKPPPLCVVAVAWASRRALYLGGDPGPPVEPDPRLRALLPHPEHPDWRDALR